MPKLSDSEADVVIIRWLKVPGEGFRRGEALLEVETDKATVVYEAEDEGTLETILVSEGESAAVGQPIARLTGSGSVEEPSAPGVSNGSPEDGVRPNATPVARRTAVELGLSLHDVAGTGPGGRITREDVQRAGATAPVRPAGDARGDVTVVELTPTQVTVARRMSQSAAEIPTFTVSADADVSEVVALRRGAREESQSAPSLNDFVVKAAALVLREFPRFNASYVDGRIERSRVSTSVSPLRWTTRCSSPSSRTPTGEASARSRPRRGGSSTARAPVRSGSKSCAGGRSRSRTSACSASARSPPSSTRETAILAVGSVRRAPVEDDARQIVFRDVMTLTLSCDHRVVYGADGARFLSRLCELLERPLVLAL